MYENSSNADDSEANQEWLEKQIDLYKSKSNILIFSHRPFYSPYFPTKQDPHGDEIISQLKASGVRYVFAGNTHVFAKYKDYSEELNLVTVGAVGQYKNPLPQWVLVEISDKNEVVVDPQPLIDL